MPTSATEAMALAQSRIPASRYRTEREVLEAERARDSAQRAQERLSARWERARSVQAERGESKAAQKALKPAQPARANGHTASTPRVPMPVKSTARIRQPGRPKGTALFETSLSSIDIRGLSVNGPNRKFRKPARSPLGTSGVGTAPATSFVSDPQEQQLLESQRSQRSQIEEEKAERDRKRRVKNDQNARSKKKRAILNKAEQTGIEISEEEINAQLEVYMAGRKVGSLDSVQTDRFLC